MESPCILLCSIEETSGLCIGCGRTRGEISAWQSMTRTERLTVMSTLQERLQTIERKPRRETRRAVLKREKTGER
ncbi:DUF1289 domain-containing protein [Nitratireductor sp. GISD-1A_MAKvit]|uniref:DUF1289 domain-containing protein n=1 Tax=Nitratireductor sp. GISD-1A_MAKvit TaxID=3234198 RepID=UPI0034670DE8